MTDLPQTYPGQKKLGLVIDLDICVGCHACATACKEWNSGGGASFSSGSGAAITTSSDQPSVSISYPYTVTGAPSAAIGSPADGQTYGLGQPVATSFLCTEGPNGPGIKTCSDGSVRPGGAGRGCAAGASADR